MGVDGPGERATVCKEGCAMSCVSMALAGHHVLIDGQEANPGQKGSSSCLFSSSFSSFSTLRMEQGR